MKTSYKLLLTVFTVFTINSAYSQAQSLPDKSPAASISQTFGITKVEVNYHCPGVKKRTVWGNPKLVPYDSVWRTGANEATTISFSTDVMVGGQKVKQGKYALFTIPGRDMWTVIINSDADQWGAYSYDKTKDVARFTVKPSMVDFRERLGFMIDPTSDSACTVSMHWEKIMISFEVTAKTLAMTQHNIDGSWRTLANAANYYVDNKLDLNKAMQWDQASISMMESFYNRYVMARIQDAKGDKKEALKYAQEAKKLGDALTNDGMYNEYKDDIAKMITALGGDTKK